MSFIDNFFINILSKKVGKDQFGNRYYQTKKQDYLGRNKRQVIYNGLIEATKVPPMWHAWLHYMMEEIPKNDHRFPWQQEYSSNITGTKRVYKVAENNKMKYSKWKPIGK